MSYAKELGKNAGANSESLLVDTGDNRVEDEFAVPSMKSLGSDLNISNNSNDLLETTQSNVKYVKSESLEFNSPSLTGSKESHVLISTNGNFNIM